ALRRSGQTRFQVIVIQVKSDIAVEISVAAVSRITFVLAPNLLGRIQVPAKSRDTIGSEDGRKDAGAGTRTSLQNSVRVHDKPADIRLLQNTLDPLGVSAFRQPDS